MGRKTCPYVPKQAANKEFEKALREKGIADENFHRSGKFTCPLLRSRHHVACTAANTVYNLRRLPGKPVPVKTKEQTKSV